MKTIYLFIFAFIFSTCALSQPTEVTLSSGKRVLLNSNGTWQYIETEPTPVSDCDSYITTETDKVTGKSSTGAKKNLIVSQDGGKSGFGIFIFKGTGDVIIFSIQAVGAGNCIDDDNKMNILFRDGTRLELTNDTKFNCDAKYSQYFGGSFGKLSELALFRTKEIETMRVWTSKSYVEENFTPAQSVELINVVDCLLK